MLKRSIHALRVFICGILIVQLTGCGTMLYPERQGQKSGSVDVGVAVLDAIWFIPFIVPGIIAYVIDFSNGTIYLPGTAAGKPLFRSTRQEIKSTLEEAWETVKQAGRNAATSIRQAFQ